MVNRSTHLILISIVMLVATAAVVSAETLTDDQSDIFHVTWDDASFSWSVTPASGYSNIDITEVTAADDGTTLTITLKVVGDIQDSDKIAYYMFYNTSDAVYTIAYADGTGVAMGIPNDDPLSMSTGEVSISGDTITTTIDLVGEAASTDFWGFAIETSVPYTEYQEQQGEWWGDWVPNSKLPYPEGGDISDDTGDDDDTTTDGDDDTDTGGGTPGFETIGLLAALVVAFILLKKRR